MNKKECMNDRKVFLLMSYEIDEIQRKQAEKLYGVRCFIKLPEKLQERCSYQQLPSFLINTILKV
ncbi:hypothetical protein AN618_17630 [Fervidicola ferrireducens]|uniref:Uncharacterized protein n=1 Tax=Fervidicola ferrireducens TaxID=520764 RepID=A0A140L5M8_9FIRM|nr:hypothetical protein [Fervidicola ferrireducens]KXG75853.1 hypothetical protein AN618_17630 [Fervidicola ferrireducens]